MNKNCSSAKYVIIYLILLGFTSIFRAFAQTATPSNVIYLSPLPDSHLVTTQTNIIIRFADKINPAINISSFFYVTGSKSGLHLGKAIIAGDQRTLLFDPYSPFAFNEKVTVQLNNGNSGLIWHNKPVSSFSFYTSVNDLNKFYRSGVISQFDMTNYLNSHQYPSNNKSAKISSANDLPSDFPLLTVDTLNNPSQGYIFLGTYSFGASNPNGRYLIVCDNNGAPLYYKKLTGYALDFKIQPTDVVTYFDYSPATNKWYIMNTSFDIIDSVTCKNGYTNDPHEIRILPNGNIILLCDDIETVDMSKIVSGGDSTAQVTGNIIQELDPDRNVIFEWRTWDHFNITDAIGQNLTATTIDYAHANAVEIDTDGNLLLSTRHMSEITKINIQTGDIMWRLGGKNNQFNFVNDTLGFSYQHAIRRLSNGDITLYDDGNLHTPPLSRAVEYKLNLCDTTATLVWQYENNPDIYGFAMGYVQRLQNGNTLIGWGAANETLTEVTNNGDIELAMHFPANVWSYRVYRFPFLFIDSTLAGKSFMPADTTQISWASSGIDSVDIYYSTDNGSNWQSIINNYNANMQNYKWVVPQTPSSLCKIKIINADYSSVHNIFISDSTFSIDNQTGVSSGTIPQKYYLTANYPNPFNPSTNISYNLPVESHVTIKIYNAIGQMVDILVNTVKPAGYHTVVFNASGLASGIYFDSIKAVSIDGNKQFSTVKKMVLLK
jgi:arylsulfate sulfotransferase